MRVESVHVYAVVPEPVISSTILEGKNAQISLQQLLAAIWRVPSTMLAARTKVNLCSVHWASVPCSSVRFRRNFYQYFRGIFKSHGVQDGKRQR